MDRHSLIEARRAFRIEGYATLAEAGMDGNFVSPLQIKSASSTGPVLLAHHWFDLESACSHYGALRRLGYLPDIPFNKVVDRALSLCGLDRGEVYMTQVFHLLPRRGRTSHVPAWAIDCSFQTITRHELAGRRVVALGKPAAHACRRNGFLAFKAVAHPSARGRPFEDRARDLAEAICCAME